MSEIQIVTDLKEPPVIGQIYIVPCVFASGCKHDHPCDTHEPAWLPITGPRHEDKDHIGFTPYHFHHDLRFTDGQVWTRLNKGTLFSLPSMPSLCVISQYDTVAGIQWLEMICVRHNPTYPDADFVGRLEHAYADAAVQCGKCPHRGVPLESLSRDADGVVECPAHGLRWNLETGKLAPRSFPRGALPRRSPCREVRGDRS